MLNILCEEITMILCIQNNLFTVVSSFKLPVKIAAAEMKSNRQKHRQQKPNLHSEIPTELYLSASFVFIYSLFVIVIIMVCFSFCNFGKWIFYFFSTKIFLLFPLFVWLLCTVLNIFTLFCIPVDDQNGAVTSLIWFLTQV